MKIIPNEKFPVSLNIWGIEPRRIADDEQIELRKDSYIMQLRYAAMEFCCSSFLAYEDCQLSRDEVEEHASVCSDGLYLNGFEGYRLTDKLTLNYLFMNKDERMCAAVYNEENDSFTYWCIY